MKSIYTLSLGLLAILFSNSIFAKQKATPLLLKKDQATEIVFVSLKPDKIKVFVDEYLPQILPIMSEYKGQFRASFSVTKVKKGDVKEATFSILQWPSIQSFIKIGQDPRVKNLIKLRNNSIANINEANFYKNANDVNQMIRVDRTYELIALSEIKNLQGIVNSLGGVVVANFLHDKNSIGRFKEKSLYLIEWPDTKKIAEFEKAIETSKWSNSVRLRMELRPNP
ncbi:MAG: hypothetical protein HRU19_01840 [Pseudobacteriovorax sp.]|nr:hypothetical protein [Pseudobacteriovorax sp.]